MYDVIVIGAGPAGIMASIVAASRGKKVLLIEKNEKIGKKLELTGGGRCNLINLKKTEDFIKEIPVNNKTLYTILNQFNPMDIYNYFIKIGVPLKIEDDDRVFPMSNKSKTIIDALYNQLINYNVTLNLNETVLQINNDDIKEIVTNKNTYKTKKVIISTGGCSYPQTGSTGDGYIFAKKINQDVTKIYPAVTFLINNQSLPLAGITLDNVNISINKKTVSGSLLFTHIGFSGPAAFKISEELYKELQDNKIATINIDLVPKYTEEELLNKLKQYNQKKELNSFIKEYLPKRLADYLVSETLSNLKIAETSNLNKKKLLEMIKNYKVDIKSTGNVVQSFVTGGGINMKYINPKTMESTINKGIYFIGELLDIHGHTGGYNITIALSTAYVAGISI